MDLKGRRVFLSGPMTGLPHHNVDEFAQAHSIVKEAGADVVYDPGYAWLYERADVAKGKTHEDYMLDCIHELTRRAYTGKPYYDVLVSVGRWWESDGATKERDVAEACGIECVDVDTILWDAEHEC